MTEPRPSLWKRFVRVAKRPIWHTVHALTGHRMGMDVNYLDMAMAGGVFRIPADQATMLVSNDRFAPSIDEDGYARCHITALEYRRIDILYPYNELAITVPGTIHAGDRATEFHYYLHLPVTTEDARWPGVEIYGFPKTVAAIDFEQTEGELACSLTVADQQILTLRVSKGEATEDEWRVDNLTFLDGEPVVSIFRGRGPRHVSDVPGGAKLWCGEHPMAREIGSALTELTSVSHFYCAGIEGSLSAPIKLNKVAHQRRPRIR